MIFAFKKNRVLRWASGVVFLLVAITGCKHSEPKPVAVLPSSNEPQIYFDTFDTLTAKVKSGESFNLITKNIGLSDMEATQLLLGIKENFRFKLYTGQVYRLIQKRLAGTKTFQAFILDDRYSEHKHILTRLDSVKNLQYTLVNLPIRTDTVHVIGNLENNLYDAFLSKGETPTLIQQVTKIFAWDIDFYKDPRVGDAFSLLVEKRYGEDGVFRGYGQVLSAKYVNRGKEFYGILFNGSYFNKEGKSLEKMLLKVPLNFARVSSGFSSSRLHPILGVSRPHWGVDYAAPKGTHIFAAGDGTIEYAKWVNGYGNTLKIRHNGIYNTYYAHLNGFVPGMCAGRRVHQGETVAFLGMTGLATGPHLDYRVECHGSFLNPASLKMEAKDGVTKSEWTDFCSHRDSLLARMDTTDKKHLALVPKTIIKANETSRLN